MSTKSLFSGWSRLFDVPRLAPVLDLESRMRTVCKTLNPKKDLKKRQIKNPASFQDRVGRTAETGTADCRKERRWIHLLQQVWPRGHQILFLAVPSFKISQTYSRWFSLTTYWHWPTASFRRPSPPWELQSCKVTGARSHNLNGVPVSGARPVSWWPDGIHVSRLPGNFIQFLTWPLLSLPGCWPCPAQLPWHLARLGLGHGSRGRCWEGDAQGVCHYGKALEYAMGLFLSFNDVGMLGQVHQQREVSN